MKGTWLAAAGATLAACSTHTLPETTTWPVAAAVLALTAQPWNTGHAELGTIAAVAEDGDRVVVFGDQGVNILAGGTLVASDASVTHWRSAARIAAADGSGQWIVGIAADGALYRLRAGTTLEPISDRYGLAGVSVSNVAALAGPGVAFALTNALAVADGQQVTRYDLPEPRNLSGAARQLAIVALDGTLRVFDVESHAQSTLPVHDATRSVYYAGHLIVQTPDVLYAQAARDLTAVHHATANLHGLVVSGDRLWFMQGSELCTAKDAHIACGGGAGISETSELFSSTSGDAWVLTDGALGRFGVPTANAESAWRAGAAAVYARVCSSCHAPGATSGIDLSTYAAWQSARAAIYQRVIIDKSMPPDRALSQEDLDTLASWAKTVER